VSGTDTSAVLLTLRASALTDPTAPPPGDPGWWRTEHEPTQPYAVPSPPRHAAGPAQPPSAAPPNPSPDPYSWPPSPDQPYADPAYGRHEPHVDRPPAYGFGAPVQGPGGYGGQPSGPYPDQPTVAYPAPGGHPGPTSYGPLVQPHQGPPGGYGAPPPRRRGRKGWLLGGTAAVLVALVGAGAVVLAGRDGDTAASAAPTGTPSSAESTTPVPTGTFTDGLTSTSPTRTPSPKERRRTLRDVDAGLAVYDDVYVKPARGWQRDYKAKYTITLGADGKGLFTVLVDPAGYDAKVVVPQVARAIIGRDHLYGVKMGAVRKVKPANSNISGQARVDFSGRIRSRGVTLSLSGRCITMTGVESIHNVTVTTCILTRRDVSSTTFRDAARMTASVARSI
jgi:hypothetical protein